MCSVFNNYLNELFELILNKNPNFYLIDGKEDVLKRFTEAKIKVKIKKMKRLGFDDVDFFSIKEKVRAPRNLRAEEFINIYEKRHIIAHEKHKRTMEDHKDFERVTDIFDRAILCLSRNAVNKYNIKTTTSELIKKEKHE